jgi:squalene synthase HpnC
MDPGTTDIERAYAECEALTRRHYENFTIASCLLPRRLRRHLWALYAFARGVDDLGDEASGDRLALLDGWEAQLRAVFGHGAAPPAPRPAAFVALERTVAECRLPLEPFLRLIEANRRDQEVHRYADFEGLLEYCTCSADPVGRLVLSVFGYHDPDLYPMSDATCTALQLTNFWQDVRRDYALGRIYLPREDLVRFGVAEKELGQAPASESFRRMLLFQVRRTRGFFNRGRPLAGHLAGHLRVDVRLFTRGGEAVLDAIERAGGDVLSRRPVVGRTRRAALLVDEWVRFLLRGGR